MKTTNVNLQNSSLYFTRKKNITALIHRHCFIWCLFFMAFCATALPARAGAASYSVQYGKEENGKFRNAYSKWNRVAAANKTITLPKVSDRANGTRCYWCADNKTGASYEIVNGGKYKVTGNVKFYARWKQTYWVRFIGKDGKTEIAGFRKRLCDGDIMKLPTLKDTSQEKFIGWVVHEKSKGIKHNVDASHRIKITGEMVIYASYRKIPKTYRTAVLKYPDGTLYRKIKLTGKEAFPSVAFPGTKTLQGWSRKQGQMCSPEYLEEETIPNINAVWYMVVYDFKREPYFNNVSGSRKYSEVYFVGDSRMYYANKSIGSQTSGIKFVAQCGKGYQWLSSPGGGYEQLIREVRKSRGKRKAVVFALGVNDLYNIGAYTTFYKRKAGELKAQGCDLYVMSVNPFCFMQRYQTKYDETGVSDGFNYRNQQLLNNFNNCLRRDLAGIYRYIDTNTYLRKTGWPTFSSSGGVKHSDGLHYTGSTNRRIINYVISTIG